MAATEVPFDVAVIGLGYVGLPTALIFAAAGRQTAGVDVNPQRVRDLENGVIRLNEQAVVELFNQPSTRSCFTP